MPNMTIERLHELFDSNPEKSSLPGMAIATTVNIR